jgi:hypothetical protein
VEESERDKLIKVLRMFGSNHDGEVASAARRAHHIVKKHALDWDDLLMSVNAKARAEQRTRHNYEARDDDSETEAFLIRRARQHDQFVTEWEREFLASISDSLVEWGRLTTRQRAVLDRICNKLELRGCW